MRQIESQEKKRKAVFLDRDGVITEEPPRYAHRLDQLALVPCAAEAIRLLNENGFLVVVVTNQSGIARGFYQEEDMHIFNNAMKGVLHKEKGARIDAIYWCPHHPEALHEQYKVMCNCRKPKSGMIVNASIDLLIDLESSFMIGDKWSDIEAGRNAGCKTIMVRTGQGIQEFAIRDKPEMDYYTANILEAIHIILDYENKHVST